MELTTNRLLYDSNISPIFLKPSICGSFSIGPARNYISDNSELKFLRGKPWNGASIMYDLNYKAGTTTTKRGEHERLEFICHYLNNNQEPIDVFAEFKVSIEDAVFINSRGFFSEISAFPYEFGEPSLISVSLFKGVVYMHTLDNPHKKYRRENVSEYEKKCGGWGYKFEQHLLSDESDIEPNLEIPLVESVEFNCFFEAKLNDHRLIYAAEMDALLCDETDKISKEDLTIADLKKHKFVELKTFKNIVEGRHITSFKKYKTLSWWLQSFFVNIETIVCGHRNDEGIVRNVKLYTVSDLPNYSREFWNPNVCLNFLDKFLTFVKSCLSKELQRRHGHRIDDIRNLPKMDLLFERDPGGNVRLCTSKYDEDEISVIPQWYVDLFPK